MYEQKLQCSYYVSQKCAVHLILLIKKRTQYHDSNCEVFMRTFRNYHIDIPGLELGI